MVGCRCLLRKRRKPRSLKKPSKILPRVKDVNFNCEKNLAEFSIFLFSILFLWIAATAKPPSEQDIAGVEGMYKALYGPESVTFPKHYPTSCLLGCVDVVDCLAQEDYKEEFPEGESESPYVFVCENPQQLTVKFPVKGQHKIWKLDPAIHKAAKGGLRKAA